MSTEPNYSDGDMNIFPSMIERYSVEQYFRTLACPSPFFISHLGIISWNILMNELDAQVQKVQYEAGKLLS